MKKNKNIAIGITTFLRDESLFRLIKSLLIYCPEFKIYIVDQGVSTPFKKVFYKGLQKQEHIIKYIPFDSGISKSRWTLKNICTEPFLVFMEDDFEASPKTNLYKLQEILEENKHIGVAGGNLQGYVTTGAYSYFLDYADNKICYFPLDYLVSKNLVQWKNTSKETKFIEADIVSDFTMWKKEVPNIFDENVKTIEHTHVYLLVKYKTNYKVAFCPESEIRHIHDNTNKNYNNFRTRTSDLEYLKKYWNVIDFYKFDKNYLYKLECKLIQPPEIKTEEPNIVKSIINKEKDMIISKNISDSQSNKIYNLANIIDNCQKNNLNFYILNKTCLDLLLKKEPDTNNIHIGFSKDYDIEKFNQLFSNHKCIIYKVHLRETKKVQYKEFKVNVPFPVIKYLEKTFNKNWKELQNGL